MRIENGELRIMNHPIQEKSFRFAVRIVNLCKYLQTEQKEYILSKQLLRSGTSIGANVSESQQAQSRPDFISKLNIALKEASETEYWLRLLFETEYLTKEQFDSIFADWDEVKSLLVAIVKSSKN